MSHFGSCKQSGRTRKQRKVQGPSHLPTCQWPKGVWTSRSIDVHSAVRNDIWSSKERLMMINELFQGNILNEILCGLTQLIIFILVNNKLNGPMKLLEVKNLSYWWSYREGIQLEWEMVVNFYVQKAMIKQKWNLDLPLGIVLLCT